MIRPCTVYRRHHNDENRRFQDSILDVIGQYVVAGASDHRKNTYGQGYK